MGGCWYGGHCLSQPPKRTGSMFEGKIKHSKTSLLAFFTTFLGGVINFVFRVWKCGVWTSAKHLRQPTWKPCSNTFFKETLWFLLELCWSDAAPQRLRLYFTSRWVTGAWNHILSRVWLKKGEWGQSIPSPSLLWVGPLCWPLCASYKSSHTHGFSLLWLSLAFLTSRRKQWPRVRINRRLVKWLDPLVGAGHTKPYPAFPALVHKTVLIQTKT